MHLQAAACHGMGESQRMGMEGQPRGWRSTVAFVAQDGEPELAEVGPGLVRAAGQKLHLEEREGASTGEQADKAFGLPGARVAAASGMAMLQGEPATNADHWSLGRAPDKGQVEATDSTPGQVLGQTPTALAAMEAREQETRGVAVEAMEQAGLGAEQLDELGLGRCCLSPTAGDGDQPRRLAQHGQVGVLECDRQPRSAGRFGCSLVFEDMKPLARLEEQVGSKHAMAIDLDPATGRTLAGFLQGEPQPSDQEAAQIESRLGVGDGQHMLTPQSR